MSHAISPAAGPTPAQARKFLKQTTARLLGRKRGPDQGEGRRVPRRNSYDEQDARAKPWAKIGDGSAAQGLAHREALLKAAKELYRQSWKEMPAAMVREARERRAALAAELAMQGLPVGRPATIRQEIARLDELLERADQRLRRIDVTILEALLEHIDFATGRLFPAIATIAAKAGCHANSVIAALRRLKGHGFVDWVRRSVQTGNDGQFAPQREQTSNAYFFDHRRKMAPRTWQRFWQILVAKMRRLGAAPPGMTASTPTIASPALQQALDRVEALLPHATT